MASGLNVPVKGATPLLNAAVLFELIVVFTKSSPSSPVPVRYLSKASIAPLGAFKLNNISPI